MFKPVWPAPNRVGAAITQTTFTTDTPGFSLPPYAAFNLAEHVGEDTNHVMANRQLLSEHLSVGPIQWLEQVHGVEVYKAQLPVQSVAPRADAVCTQTPGLAIAVLTADCLPVLFCSQAGDEIAVAHAGWRGLAQGILVRTLQSFEAPAQQILAYLGPAIGPVHFEVGEEVRQIFKASFLAYGNTDNAFTPSIRSGHFYADIYALARLQLQALGVRVIYGGHNCTFSEPQFYSYRRSANGVCGRMASVLWLQA
ncbi:MAG TPA: peptidoglycan editing factor PgeF [Cellvibrionaceae bacterium]